MSDQPYRVVDNDNDQPDNHDIQPQGWSLEDAADQLHISVNAVRQRIKRGTLQADRGPNGWVVYLPTDQDIAALHAHRPANQPPQWSESQTNRPTDQPSIAPLVDLVADLTKQNAELSAAAAIWQERARFLSERLAALEAGPLAAPASEHNVVDAPENAPDALQRDEGVQLGNESWPQASRDSVPAEVQLATGWRRWFRRVMGYEG